MTQHNVIPDVYWACGGQFLFTTHGKNWQGLCARVMVARPFTIILISQQEMLSLFPSRRRRSGLSAFDDHVYLDGICCPRGVPAELKARNQVLAGLQSTLCWWCTVNKKVDWINFIYYNQQLFVNATRDTVKGMVEQLSATSLMAWQNRIALDMLLAERGGVCSMFGDACCAVIPNHTVADGSVQRALSKLETLSSRLAVMSGDDDSGMWGWLDDGNPSLLLF